MLKISYLTISPCVLFQALHPPWQEERAFRHRCPARSVLLCRWQTVWSRRPSVQHTCSLVPTTHGEPPQPLGRALRAPGDGRVLQYHGYQPRAHGQTGTPALSYLGLNYGFLKFSVSDLHFINAKLLIVSVRYFAVQIIIKIHVYKNK